MLHDGPTIGDFRQTGVSSGNAEREARLNARKSIVSDVIFPKSVPKSISRNGLNDTGNRESSADRLWRRGTLPNL